MEYMKVEFSNERIIPADGLAVVGNILLTYIGMLCMGKPAFDSVHKFDDNPEFYRYTLGITRNIPSEKTLRQRMDSIGGSLCKQALSENVEMLRMNGIVPSKLPNGFVLVDIDVMPFDNFKTKKEGGSRNYQRYDGYALIMAYIGTEGYLINAAENIGILLETGCYFTKEYSQHVAALRKGKTVYIGSDWKTVSWKASDGTIENVTIRACYEVIERTIDKYGQFLLPADIEVNTWWTNTDRSDNEIIERCHAHGECEQFHSEIKSDMDVERLPSEKFATNELVLELTILAYNILRMIGQETIGRRTPKAKRKACRRRLRTVIGNLI